MAETVTRVAGGKMEMNVDSAGTANCAECNLVFPFDSMIRYKSVYVCANCKPVFMQKLAEGAHINTGELRWAGFWIRLAASFVDGFLMIFVVVGVQLALGLSMGQIIGLEERTAFMWVAAQLLSTAMGVVYDAGMTGRWGATLGKMACGIKVVMPDGSPISYPRAIGRYFAKLLSYLTIYIGFIMAAFDNQKRSLHDRVCNTRVVYK
jgi:uncharacterized RDD family membrane protein YckC